MCLFYIIKFNCAIKIKTLNKFVRARICVFFFALGSAGAVKSIAFRKKDVSETAFKLIQLNLINMFFHFFIFLFQTAIKRIFKTFFHICF